MAATRSCKVAATKSRKVAATKSSKTNLHMKNSQAATMPQLAAATKLHHCCLFAAKQCEMPFISIREELNKLLKFTVFTLTVTTVTFGWQGPQNSVAFNFYNLKYRLWVLVRTASMRRF